MRRSLALAFVCFTALWAQDSPNFSGTWRMVPDESDFAGATVPKNRVEKITQSGTNISEDVSEGSGSESKTATIHYTTDGKPVQNNIFGTEVTSTARWDGPDLVVRTTATAKGKTEIYEDRWTLSLNGDTLTVRRHHDDKGLEADQMLIYHKHAANE